MLPRRRVIFEPRTLFIDLHMQETKCGQYCAQTLLSIEEAACTRRWGWRVSSIGYIVCKPVLEKEPTPDKAYTESAPIESSSAMEDKQKREDDSARRGINHIFTR